MNGIRRNSTETLVTVVEAPQCHYCEHANRALDQLSQRFTFRVERLTLDSPAGAGLVARHGIPFPPLVLVNGDYFGHGRISSRKLERHLTALMDAS